jgi:hypothetical protein
METKMPRAGGSTGSGSGSLLIKFTHSDELTRLYNEERLKNKELESELADIRLILKESQTGIFY